MHLLRYTSFLFATVSLAAACSSSETNPLIRDTTDSGTKPDSGGTVVVPDPEVGNFTVGGNVTGLAGSELVLQNNAGDDLPVTASGTFTFATKVSTGSPFAVTVLNQPTLPSQNCAVVGAGSGTMGKAAVSNIAVACTTNGFKVGGTVSGLAGTGPLKLSVNGGAAIDVTANGPFSFPAPLASGATFAVTIAAQPTTPAQVCNVSGETGSVVAEDVTSVNVNCAVNTYTVGGTATVAGTGLVLQNNGADDLKVTATGKFAFSKTIGSGTAYAVTIKTQPVNPSQTCVLAMPTGSVTTANIASVGVTCTTNKYTVGGNLTGHIAGKKLTLQNNLGDNLDLSANGAFTFKTAIDSAKPYAVKILTDDGAESCVLTANSGKIAGANITNVGVACTPCGKNDAALNGRCFYLDGSGGVCATGYTLAVGKDLDNYPIFDKLFDAKTYYKTPPSDCCIQTGTPAVTRVGVVAPWCVPGKPSPLFTPGFIKPGCLLGGLTPTSLSLCATP
jgi:large repetitive protein